MPEIRSADGRYLCADQGRNSFVLYDLHTGAVLWDRWAHEGGLQNAYPEDGSAPPVPPSPSPDPSVPPVRPPTTEDPGAGGGGGIHEHVSSTIVRPRFSRTEMASFLPDRGPFHFPPPYSTRGIRLTNASDGNVRPVGMAYWPVINNSAGRAHLFVMLSLDDTLTLLAVQKDTGAVERRGSLPFHHTGEGCAWSLTDPDRLYVPQGNALFAFDVRTHQVQLVFEAPGLIDHVHSSADGRVHAMTLDGSAAVVRDGALTRYPAQGDFDESQIDKSGRWLLSKETFQRNGRGHLDNRVFDLHTGREFVIRDEDGAVGHSDMGHGYIIGEDDQANPGGVFRCWVFTPDGPIDVGPIYSTDWTGMTRYVSHCNAQPGPGGHQIVVMSSSYDGDAPRANEIVVVPLDGSELCRVVAPNLTDLNASGGGDPYWRKVRAAVDPTGQWAIWTGNAGTERLDAFMVQL